MRKRGIKPKAKAKDVPDHQCITTTDTQVSGLDTTPGTDVDTEYHCKWLKNMNDIINRLMIFWLSGLLYLAITTDGVRRIQKKKEIANEIMS